MFRTMMYQKIYATKWLYEPLDTLVWTDDITGKTIYD